MSHDSKDNDWHPADIVASMRKRGNHSRGSIAGRGLSSSTLANANPAMAERRMADCQHTRSTPSKIWPSRYMTRNEAVARQKKPDTKTSAAKPTEEDPPPTL